MICEVGALKGLKLAGSLGHRKLIFESDSTTLVNGILNRRLHGSNLFSLFKSIFGLIEQFSHFQMKHRWMEANGCVLISLLVLEL